MQQGLVQQGFGGRISQAIEAGKMRAKYRPDTLLSQHMHLHVSRPRGFSVHQQCIEPWTTWVEVTFPCGQVQAQLRQIRLQATKPWDKPTRQQAPRAAQHKWRLADIAAEFCTHAAQPVEGLTAGIAQTHTGICEFDATPVLDEKRHPQVLLQHLDLPTDSAMGNMQRFSRLADAVKPGGSLEGAQGIQGREIVGHFTCEFF